MRGITHQDIKELTHKSYLAGVIDHIEPLLAGKTFNAGVKGRVATMIFVDNINTLATNAGVASSTYRQGAVIHELGHARAARPHLCNGSVVFTAEHNSPNATFTCIMANSIVAPLCAVGKRRPIDFIDFCSKCQDAIKAVNW